MGKTKIKVIDAETEEVKKPTKKLGRQDELVEKLKAELEGVSAATTKKSESQQPVIPSPTDSSPESTLSAANVAQNDKIKKSQKPGKVKPRSLSRAKSRGKKYQEISQDLDRSKTYLINEAVEMVKKLSYTKFTGTLEIHINTISAGIRGLVSLPFVSGKKLQILAFPPSSKTHEGQAAKLKEEGVTIGDDSTIEEINKGKVNFDLIITTPEWMPKLAKVAKILGPRGLMPNPKNGTITDDLKKAVESFQSGKIEYKTEQKAPVIHLGLGKLDQPTEQLQANIKTLLQTLGKTRVKKVTLSPTMGPSVKVDLASF